jgi:hypothetical protein
MHRNIRVGMAHKCLIVRDFESAQHNVIAGAEPVNVIPIAQPNLHPYLPHVMALCLRFVRGLCNRSGGYAQKIGNRNWWVCFSGYYH